MKHSRSVSHLKKVAPILALSTAITAGMATSAEASGSPMLWKGLNTERVLNARTQHAVNELAKMIIEGPVNRKGGTKYVPSWDSKGQEALSSVVVSAQSLYDTQPGRYSFLVVSPVDETGKLDLYKVRQVIVEEGVETPYGGSSPYAELTFIKNVRNGAWAIRGDYLLAKSNQMTAIEANVKPSMSNEAQLNFGELKAAVTQAQDIVHYAEEHQPTGALQPAFNQPDGTVPYQLK